MFNNNASDDVFFSVFSLALLADETLMTSVADLPCMLPNTYAAVSARDSMVEGRQSFIQLADQALVCSSSKELCKMVEQSPKKNQGP